MLVGKEMCLNNQNFDDDDNFFPHPIDKWGCYWLSSQFGLNQNSELPRGPSIASYDVNSMNEMID